MKNRKWIKFYDGGSSIEVGSPTCSGTEHCDRIVFSSMDEHNFSNVLLTIDEAEDLIDFLRKLIADQKEWLAQNDDK